MLQLLKIEWLKIKNYRTFWILILLFISLFTLQNYGIIQGSMKFGSEDINLMTNTYSFPDVWATVSYWGSWFVFFIAILVIILVTNEIQFKTNRQNIIDGLSRLEFFHSKVYLVLVFSFALTLFIMLLGFIFGGIVGHSFYRCWDSLQYLGYFFVLSVNYLGFAMLIAFWVKKSGMAISLLLLYSFVIENILSSLMNYKIAKHVGDFLPLQSSDELMVSPIHGITSMIMHDTPPNSLYYLGTSIIWIILYYFATRSLILKKDL